MLNSFLWGEGGQKMTPEQVERQRELVDAARGRAGDTSPVGHWTQGAARVVDALGGVLRDRRTDKAESAGMASADEYIANNPILASKIGLGDANDVSDYRKSLISTESGGNWGAKNSEIGAGGKAGHFGRAQFGHARLKDAMDAGAIPKGVTPQQFMASPELQMAAENWHFADLEEQLAPFVGAQVGGQTLDLGALIAMGHLGGAAGARKYVETGGEYNPSDSFGTSLSDYAKTHSGKGGAAAPQGMGNNASVVQALAGAMSNPWVAKKYGPVIQALMGNEMKRGDMQYQQQLQQQDPMYQAKLAQIITPEAFDPFAGTQVINGHLVTMGKQGPQVLGDYRTQEKPYRPLSPEEAAGMGLPKGAYQIGPDNKVSQIGSAGVTVNNDLGGGPELGKLSTDYGYVLDPTTRAPVIDPNTGLPKAAPVPGSPAARDIESSADKAAERARQSEIKMGTTLKNIGLNIAELEDGGFPVTGPIGVLASNVPGTAAADFSARTNQINTRAALDEVQNMRDNSPTGGAVGQLTDSEREAISIAATSLSQSVSKDEYVRSAKNFRKLMLDIAYGDGNWSIDEKGRLFIGGQGGKDIADFSTMEIGDIGQVDIGSLTPEQLDALEARMSELGL